MSITTRSPLILSLIVVEDGISLKIAKSYNKDEVGRVMIFTDIDKCVKRMRDLMMDCRDANNLNI